MAKAPEDIARREETALRAIREAVRGVRYGTVTVTVQDGVVIQVDRTEKVRLDYSRDGSQWDGSGI